MIVSIAIVAYNEESTIGNLLNDIEQQTYPKDRIELLLINSMSTDKTSHLMKEFADKATGYKRIVLLDNPKKWQSAGCNVALASYTGDVFIRIDAHASIPQDFIAKNVANLESGEMVSGGQRPNIIDGDSSWKKTLLMAESSMFGSSFALYRRSNAKRYVTSMFHGAYRREVFDQAGNYNEKLFRTEDNEMSYRIRHAGYKMCYDPNIISYQHTRSTLVKMLKQKYLNGYWIALTLSVRPKCLSLYHFAPLCFVLAIVGTGIMAISGMAQPALLLLSCYLVADLLMTIQAIVQGGFKFTHLFLPLLFPSLHISYGIGTIVGLFHLPFKAKALRGKD